MVLRDIQGSINSLGSGGGARLANSSAGGSAGARAIPAKASAVGKLRCVAGSFFQRVVGVILFVYFKTWQAGCSWYEKVLFLLPCRKDGCRCW